MFKYGMLLLIGFNLVISSAHAGWKYQSVNLVNENDSQDSIPVSIDYEVKMTEEAHAYLPIQLATPLHINAWATRAPQNAQVVFRSMYFNSYGISLAAIFSGHYEFFLNPYSTEILDMTIEGQHLFASPTKPALLWASYGYKSSERGVQEIAIVIDGIWYKGLNQRDARFSLSSNDGN